MSGVFQKHFDLHTHGVNCVCFSHPWFDFFEFELNWFSNTLVVAAGSYIPACPES